jgi:hypothetical protein
VKTANHATVNCSVRTRPMRSASAPAIHPPIADDTSVAVPISPASALAIANAAMMAGMAKLNIWTSMPSSIQPAKHAQNVLFSSALISEYHKIG